MVGAGAFDPVHRTLASRGKKVRLTPLENDALFEIAFEGHGVCPVNALAASVWGCASAAETSACRQLLSGLRAKLYLVDLGVSLITASGCVYLAASASTPG